MLVPLGSRSKNKGPKPCDQSRTKALLELKNVQRFHGSPNKRKVTGDKSGEVITQLFIRR